MTFWRLFVTKVFDRWCRKERLSDDLLCEAVAEMARGLVDASLGGNLYKKRVAAPGRGKRGSYRTVLAFKSGSRACFLFGFPKNVRDNIDAGEARALKALAKEILGYEAKSIRAAVKAGALRELRCEL